MLEMFLKLRSSRDNLFQRKQREPVKTKECSEGIHFNFKNLLWFKRMDKTLRHSF